MSFARFEDGFDVYVFHNSHGFYECQCCRLLPSETWFRTARDMVDHILEHRIAGHRVPASIESDLMDSDPFLFDATPRS